MRQMIQIRVKFVDIFSHHDRPKSVLFNTTRYRFTANEFCDTVRLARRSTGPRGGKTAALAHSFLAAFVPEKKNAGADGLSPGSAGILFAPSTSNSSSNRVRGLL